MTLRQRLWRVTKRLFALAVTLVVLGLGAIAGVYWYYSRDLPSVEELKTWRPAQVTKVTCRDGHVCAEFYTERRTWVDVQTLPKHVRDSFLAAEDADFYQHDGLDYFGIVRSALKNLRPGAMKSGASTISQQACRRLLLSQERTFARKVKEWILTPRMEKALTKDEILNLYVNTIWFGHNRYGIEEAALFYFGKHAKDLSLGEAAVLAGTVQLPHRINPLTNVVKAKRRQKYVLGQLWQHGFVSKEKAEAELEVPIQLGPRPPTPVGQYYAETVRQQLIARYGERAVMEGGMRVQIAMEPRLQAAAEASVRAGLEAVDKRQGYRGALGNVDQARFAALRPALEKRLAEAGRRNPNDVLVADLNALKDLQAALTEDAEPQADSEEAIVDPEEKNESEDEKIARTVSIHALSEGLETVARVSSLDDEAAFAVLDVIGREARLDFAGVKWARKPGAKSPVKLSEVLAPGDLIRVRLGKALPASQTLEASLMQIPVVQGALLSIDPADRSVVAMVGGYDFARSAFNRAIQAKRQPGSSFKPFLYGAAMATGKTTPISVFNDAPFSSRDATTGQTWKPHNYDGRFDGPMTIREALTKSKNTVSVRLIESIGPEAAIEFAHQAGIRSELPVSPTLALGTGEVSMLEIANAYTTLEDQGRLADPVIIVQVSDASGKVLEEHHSAPEQALPAAVAYLVTSLMRSVVEEGTAVAVLELARPAAGKTGTANECRDAWFSGFTADFVTSAWVGFDDHSPIGPNETGGKAALPLWLEYMKVANAKLPKREFPVPEGIVQVRIDPQSGRLAGRAVPGRLESFLAGTEPTELAAEQGTIDPNDFVLQSGNRR